ncbi:hypothetical protein BZA77DRAFT_354716 [Pyronema omphalodes]|nr:hypothetical protein BZA77DRAFT_354716 [Pyronema omphalodes]
MAVHLPNFAYYLKGLMFGLGPPPNIIASLYLPLDVSLRLRIFPNMRPDTRPIL